MAVLKRIGVLSAAKIQAFFGAIGGLLVGIAFAFIGSMFTPIMGGGMASGFGIASIIIFPIIYGAVGFLACAIGAALYNLVAKWIGGLEMDFGQ